MPRSMLLVASLVALWVNGVPAAAAEPNEDFDSATDLGPGVFTVSDEVTSFGFTGAPDTTLGAFDESGLLLESDDDGSDLGDGAASALFDVPVNADGSIELLVSGFPDFDFDGFDDDEPTEPHFEEGEYDLFVTVFDAAGDFLDTTGDFGELFFGTVDSFSFSDPAWIGGTFDVEIDNFLLAEPSDVDFFRFSGLDPTLPFTAEIVDGDFDTVLGLFDPVTGELLDDDDDAGDGLLSLLSGDVPASGEIVLAVTGFADFDFIGFHGEAGLYTLVVTQIPEPTAAWLLLSGLFLRRR